MKDTLLPSLSFQNKMQQFNASVIISEQLNRLMVNAAQELAQRAVSACSEHYKFDADEAISLLGLNNVKLQRKSAVKDEEVKEKSVIQIEGDDDHSYDDHSYDDDIDEMAMVLIQTLNAYNTTTER